MYLEIHLNQQRQMQIVTYRISKYIQHLLTEIRI